MYSECQRSCVHSKIKNNVPQYQRKCQRLTKFNTLYIHATLYMQKKRNEKIYTKYYPCHVTNRKLSEHARVFPAISAWMCVCILRDSAWQSRSWLYMHGSLSLSCIITGGSAPMGLFPYNCISTMKMFYIS